MTSTDQTAAENIPDNANQHCPGTDSEQAGKSAACEGCPNQQICATAPKGPDPDLVAIAQQLSQVKHIILVLSGKGGVGKSTVSAQLAYALSEQGKEVGLLDIDICGPSIPKMLGLEGEEIHQSALGWSPVYVTESLGVMSIGFMLPDPDDAVIWRGPRKNSLIKQFLKDVNWGPLDYLVVDAPPGTSDEHISIAQFLRGSQVEGAVIVTTPQEVAIIDVRKEVNFCRKVGLPILGVVENMSGLSMRLSDVTLCSHPTAVVTNGGHAAHSNGTTPASPSTAGTDTAQQQGHPGQLPAPSAGLPATAASPAALRDRVQAALQAAGLSLDSIVVHTEVFHASKGGASAMCKQMGVPFLGKVPLDGALSRAAEQGQSIFEAAAAAPSSQALRQIIEQLQQQVEAR